MMNQEDIFKKIGQILNELNDQYQYLAQNPQELNELELELFLANSSFLADHVQIIKKLNSKAIQKSLPEHTTPVQPETASQTFILPAEKKAEPEVVIERVLPVQEVEDVPAATGVADAGIVKPVIDEEIFKPDNTPSPFEFILNEKPSTDDRFEFEEKSVDEIFDRPLSKEEEFIIAQKQKLREKDSLELQLPEEDEIGPEPFLVSEDTVSPQEEIVPEAQEDIELEEEEEPIEEPAEDEPVIEEAVALAETTIAPSPIAEPVTTPFAAAQEELFMPLRTPVEAYVPPLAETLTPENTPKPTLNDILSGNAGGRNYGADKAKMEIKDLKQAISLNDKMRYIKDLFNGYNLAYAEAIDLLNKMPDFKTADAFLKNNYSVKNNWADKQETADQFYELLNQRFPVK
jgi:hypothetical protein